MVLESKRTKQHKVKQDVAEACTLESEPRRQKVSRPAKRPQERARISALIDKDWWSLRVTPTGSRSSSSHPGPLPLLTTLFPA